MIRILTDSASDLTATDSARPGVYTVPLSVTFADGTGGLDGVELTADEFYAHLKEDVILKSDAKIEQIKICIEKE